LSARLITKPNAVETDKLEREAGLIVASLCELGVCGDGALRRRPVKA